MVTVASGRAVLEALDHVDHRNRVVGTPHDVQRRRMRLDRAGVAVLLASPLFDVADEAREDEMTVFARDELRVRGDLVVVDRRSAG